MNALPTVVPEQHQQVVALLCVPDSAGEPSPALALLYGQPFLHHLIKRLESRGITRFVIGVETISGALLRYRDAALSAGLEITFVRHPGELATQINDDTTILVQSADIYIDAALIDQALAAKKPLLATVEEQSENQHYERIDLNSRWAGLAILQKHNLASLTEMPDGWDMGSALLRQALQDGVPRWPVAQKHIQSGALRKLGRADGFPEDILDSHHLLGDDQKSLEKYIFSSLVRRTLPAVWTTSWSRPLVEWLFPATAAFSFFAAIMNSPLVGGAVAVLSIFSSMLRRQVYEVEYQTGKTDWLGAAGWVLLGFALGGLLFHAELSRPEGAFVMLSMLGLSIFGKSYWDNKQFWLSSPLVIALVAAFGEIAGEAGWAVRALILVELGALLLSRFRADKTRKI